MHHARRRNILRRVLPVLLLIPLVTGAAAAQAAATPAHPSHPVGHSARQLVTPELIGIRFGRQQTFDRIVADFRGPLPQVVQYQWVPQLIADPSGNPVYIPGQYFLSVVIQGAAAHDPSGQLTYTGPRQFGTLGLGNVQAVAVTGDFEATLSLGMGTQRTSWVNTFILANPTRVVVDIGH